MERLVLIITLLITLSVQADEECELLIGAWHGESTNLNTGHYNKFTSTYSSDLTFKSNYESYSVEGKEADSDPDQGTFEQGGTWECSDSVLTKHSTYHENESHDPITKRYKILSISSASLTYKTLQGHTEGKVYEVYRLE